MRWAYPPGPCAQTPSGSLRVQAAQGARPGDQALHRERHQGTEGHVGVALEGGVARLPLREELAVEVEQPLHLEEPVGLAEGEAQEALLGRQRAVVAQELPEGVEVQRDAVDAALAAPGEGLAEQELGEPVRG